MLLKDLDLLEVRISRTLMVNMTAREKIIAVLPKDTFSMIQVPKQSSAGNSLVFTNCTIEIIKTLQLVSKTTQSTATAAFSLFFLLTLLMQSFGTLIMQLAKSQ
ncbi:hypothetical protein FGO68_gene528 [Halteria grandinella]|uniref:Uncharacterized protein n=1 Tax=Halteria grandinella TaxID=5974 RepID=A0A8J8SUY9_HALGN|nr:hypothetical protein FGO68_gene528 [Halteria grandinella]